MKIKFEVPSEHADPDVLEHMNRTRQFAYDIQGDQVGPFDHPEGTAADEPFQVAHELGEIPGALVIEDPGYTGRGVYATEVDREAWTKDTITIRSADPTNKNIVIRVRRKFTDA